VPKDAQVFLFILSILLAAGVLYIVASICGDYAIGKLGGEVVWRLRMDLFRHIQRMSASFYQRFKLGDIVTRFTADMASIESLIRSAAPFFLKECLSVLLGLTVLFTIEWKLTLVMLVGSSLMFLGPRLLQSRAESGQTQYKEAQERLTDTMDEMVRGHKTIQNLHQQDRFLKQASGHIQRLFTLGLRLHRIHAWMERLPLTALLLLNGIMLGFGGYLILQDDLSVGGFIAFFTLFMTVGQSGTNLTFIIPNLIESGVSFRRINELLEQQPGVPEAASPVELDRQPQRIRMEQVSFGYTDTTDQVKGLNLTIEPGSYVALVGPSGSGKSTVLQLLARFYDPREGAVRMGSLDLRDVRESSYREHCTLVSQDTYLFNGTVRDNLLLDAKRTDEEMIQAAVQAQLHATISRWPQGYETIISQEGGSLSGGERQRMAIARALLRDPQLLLLDEVTAALDPATEAEINQLLEYIRPGRTIISVTHRLASIVNADRIHVFHQGQIAESGTHQELLTRKGLYADMWDKQHGFQLSGDGLHASVDADRLAKLPFFNSISHSLLEEIATRFTTEVCEQGEFVVREGEEGSKFYIIVRGRFAVCKQASNGEEVELAVLQDGDYFGEIALLKEIPRTATVRSLGSAVLLSIRREAFHQLMVQSPQILDRLERILQARMEGHQPASKEGVAP